MDLHPLEQKVLEGLKKLNGSGTAEEVAKAGDVEKIQAERFGYSLSQKGIVDLQKKENEVIELTELGKKYLKDGLPEKKLLKKLGSDKKTVPELAETAGLEPREVSAILGILRKNAFVSVLDGKVSLTGLGKDAIGKELPAEKALVSVSNSEKVEDALLQTLKKRGLVNISIKAHYELTLKNDVKVTGGKTAHQLTHEMLKTGKWKGKTFRKYDLNAPVPKIHGGRMHPLTIAKNKIRRIFLELGFEEAEGPLVESTFWNFDALFQPQDHPARDLADTFYLKNPEKTQLPDPKMVDAVKKAHEEGTVGSSGWQYDWQEDVSKQPILRTHTTSVTARWLSKSKPPAKIFSIGRVFRNETLDYKHLPEFTQIDGIVIDENVTFNDLLGYLKEFFYRMGFEKVRFRPAYFPYTEMSTEIEVWLPERKEWIELGGSGLLRPEVTEPLGINVPVLAWGLSLERPIMMRLGLKDIRSFYYFNDLKWLREVVV
ncbi:MAG: phenylalanine--tRNA ligase subunit alpha [Candidatus Undinarchaeales archaeon]|jgi:phenylalanyl-tRNA synthetase alpha chain|nr:phenylalanine--tRNA ligase subunit alpha [Candidatus Undinarchaeales archaeon]